MNKTLAEFLVADGRPKKTKNYPELNGFLYAVACSPEMIEAEQWLVEYSRETGLPYAVVRPTPIYGPGDKRLLRLIFPLHAFQHSLPLHQISAVIAPINRDLPQPIKQAWQ